MPDRTLARRLAQESLARGDATGWFEALYSEAQGNSAIVPWADLAPNPNLLAWLDRKASETSEVIDGHGRKALVVGCGLGDDAEELAARGFQVTAFDVSPTAITWCRRRYPDSSVNYCVADVLALPAEWQAAFDFVVEIFTLQVLPPELRATAATQLAACVTPGGTLLVIARAREPHEDPGAMPWPLTKDDLLPFPSAGLHAASFEDFLDQETPPVRRFRVAYKRG